MEGDFQTKACCGAAFGHTTFCQVGQAINGSYNDGYNRRTDELGREINKRDKELASLRRQLEIAEAENKKLRDDRDMWLFSMSEMWTFSKGTNDFCEKFGPWMDERLKEYDERQAALKEIGE